MEDILGFGTLSLARGANYNSTHPKEQEFVLAFGHRTGQLHLSSGLDVKPMSQQVETGLTELTAAFLENFNQTFGLARLRA